MEQKPVRILSIEDNPGDARLLREFLNQGGGRGAFEFFEAPTLREGLHLLESTPCDIVVLDFHLPDSSGFQSFKEIRARFPDLAIMIMTALDDEDIAMKLVQEGCQDYLVKGQFDPAGLTRAVRYAIERDHFRKELQTLSLKDPLTGLHNRRGFFLLAEQQIKSIGRSSRNRGFLICLADLDGLKQINDNFGHASGDKALSAAGEILKAAFRQSDVIARLGGDEFAVMSLDGREQDEKILRGRLENYLKNYKECRDWPFPFSLSFGFVYCHPRNPRSIEDLLAEADRAMYRQKHLRQSSVFPEKS